MAIRYAHATVWERFAAVILDALILGLIGLPINILVGLYSPQAMQIMLQQGTIAYMTSMWYAFLLGICIFFAYHIFFEGVKSQTPGKMLLKLKVVDKKTGECIGIQRAFVRTALRYVDEIPFILPYLLGYLLIRSSPDRQRIGDKAANSIVISLSKDIEQEKKELKEEAEKVAAENKSTWKCRHCGSTNPLDRTECWMCSEVKDT